MPSAADRRGSAAWRLVCVAPLSGALVHELPVDGSEDSLLAYAESWIGLGRLRHRHDRLLLRLVSRGRTEMVGESVGCEPEHSLQLGDPLGLRCGLASQPLGHRRLGDAQRGSKLPLGQAAFGPGAPQRSREVLPLVGRRHVRVLSQVEGT
jgi:hypothetical protein